MLLPVLHELLLVLGLRRAKRQVNAFQNTADEHVIEAGTQKYYVWVVFWHEKNALDALPGQRLGLTQASKALATRRFLFEAGAIPQGLEELLDPFDRLRLEEPDHRQDQGPCHVDAQKDGDVA